MEQRRRERVPSFEEGADASTYSSPTQTGVTLCRFHKCIRKCGWRCIYARPRRGKPTHCFCEPQNDTKLSQGECLQLRIDNYDMGISPMATLFGGSTGRSHRLHQSWNHYTFHESNGVIQDADTLHQQGILLIHFAYYQVCEGKGKRYCGRAFAMPTSRSQSRNRHDYLFISGSRRKQSMDPWPWRWPRN